MIYLDLFSEFGITGMLRNTITTHPMFHDSDFPSSSNLNDEQKKLVTWFNAKVGCGEIQMEEVPYLCGSDRFDILSNFDRYRAVNRVVLCHDCGLIRSNPRMTQESLKGL